MVVTWMVFLFHRCIDKRLKWYGHEVTSLESRRAVVISFLFFLVPIVVLAVFFPNGWELEFELALMVISFSGLFVMLYIISTRGSHNLTSYYRPRPSQHFCLSCNFPYASVRNEVCANCGSSLRLERTEP